jgi:Fe-S cluster biosynthesis and repair protein YggX
MAQAMLVNDRKTKISPNEDYTLMPQILPFFFFEQFETKLI